MAGATLKIEGAEGPPAGTGSTVINLTFHQESGMAYLCKGAAFVLRLKTATKDAAGTPPAHRPCGGEQKALGVAQILLGAVCIGIGVALNMVEPNDGLPFYYKRAIYNGVPYWMGSLFILSGTFSMVGARHGGNWVHLATFLNLGSVVAGSVAFTLGLTDVFLLMRQPYFIESICKQYGEYRNNYRSWEPTNYPPYNGEDQREANRCQEIVLVLVHVLNSTHILLLILHTAALAIALFCFGYGLRRLCYSCWGGWKDYMAVDDADVSEEPGKELNPA